MFYLFFFLLIIVFSFGLIFSDVKMNIKQLEVESLSKKINFVCKINIGIFLFGKIKVFGFNISEEGIRFFNKKITFKRLQKNENIRMLERNFKFEDLKNMNLKIRKLDLKLDIGFEDIGFTVFSVFLISTILSFIINRSVDKFKFRRYMYTVVPKYLNSNFIHLKVNSIITAKTVHIIHVILNNRKRSVDKNERTSYRRSYANSNE